MVVSPLSFIPWCSAFFLTPPPPQIDRQLQTYLQRVEAVLGKDWEKHVEGQKLKQDGDSFRQKLNTMQVRVQERVFCSKHVKQGDSTFFE